MIPAKTIVPTTTKVAGAAPGTLSSTGYAYLQTYIQAESGIVIDADKRYMLESRLLPLLSSPVAKSLGISTLEQLSYKLKISPHTGELSKLVLDAMTTNETFFFRDEPMFDALRDNLLPGMFSRAHNIRRVRIWSAASSSGQEAYSIAMLIREMGLGATSAEIIGTDLSAQMVQRAREGLYTQAEINRGLPPAYLPRYFSKRGSGWQISTEIRSMVRFEPIDLRRNIASLGIFDLILCRNVLIYFDTDTKKKIINAIRPMLATGAALVLGCAETVINISSDFRREQIGSANFYLPEPRNHH